MSDQLSLRLRADLPQLPTDLRPMLAITAEAPFDSVAHLFEPAWGGRRALALIGPAPAPGGGEVRFVGENGEPITTAFPELIGLASRVDARSAVLDGELVVADAAGRPDPVELDRRMSGQPGRPLAYLAFDLLHLDGRSLLRQPLLRRRELLDRVLRPGDELVAVPAILGEGVALHAAVAAQGLAGIMARIRYSPYLPGTASRMWRFIPCDGERTGPAPGSGATAEEHPSDDPAASPAPILTLLSRLPLDLDE
jgi:ATP-dependent DNA ligase